MGEMDRGDGTALKGGTALGRRPAEVCSRDDCQISECKFADALVGNARVLTYRWQENIGKKSSLYYFNLDIAQGILLPVTGDLLPKLRLREQGRELLTISS